jgi:hypothetical protein
MSTEANIIRIECDKAQPYQGITGLTNKVTGERVRLPRGRDIQVELGVRERGVWIVDVESELASITVEVKATRTGAATVTVTDAGPFALCQESEWTSDTKQHAAIQLPNGQTSGFTIGSSGEADYWMVITATTVSGKAITLAAGVVTAIEDGGNYSATTPSVGDANYVTQAQLLTMLPSGSNLIIEENGFRGRLGFDENGNFLVHMLQ